LHDWSKQLPASKSTSATLISWFEANQRDLPWRNTSPWGVLVSEFMLQQTPVNRVLPIWNEWMQRWPTAKDLAAAPKPEVIKAWGRLGYPRRALRLHESAKVITTLHDNQVPRSREELIALPGVGDYTAAAIAAFAFGEPALVLDINIRRFFARYYDGIETPSAAPSQVERKLRYELIPDRGGDLWAAATMEFGALICTARSPLCDTCPLANQCRWRAAGYPPSAAIKKQAKFTGSDRQCRGTVLGYLRENNRATLAKLAPLWPDGSQLEKALKTLIADGLIETTGKSYRLAG
jgi:A/G-specific adenine glycosylase